MMINARMFTAVVAVMLVLNHCEISHAQVDTQAPPTPNEAKIISVDGLSARDADQLRELCEPIIRSHLAPWIQSDKALTLSGSVDFSIAPKSHHLDFSFQRLGEDGFNLVVEHDDYACTLYRDQQCVAIILPKFKKAYFAELSTVPREDEESLALTKISKHLVSTDCALYPVWQSVHRGDPSEMFDLLVTGLTLLNGSQVTMALHSLEISNSTSDKKRFSIKADAASIDVEYETIKAHLQVDAADRSPSFMTTSFEESLEGLKSRYENFAWESVDPIELETTFARGIARATEILAPGPKLLKPSKKRIEVENGVLDWNEGQRFVRLSGSPEEIGRAHGQLLRKECWRCIDSVLYTFGIVQTVAKGKWFRSELETAYRSLDPHIPERHKAETNALASSIGIDRHTLQIVNVFPELFHCSGFAVFGSNTVDGKLYHGRVLDYMTTIGLQDSATTFIIDLKDQHHDFATIGYAGFIGSVSGMNSEKISLGEMGGRGEGSWRGVPMATLMRRALEECGTLDDVRKLWTDNPRTCEYFYVFADGKSRTAIGCSATHEAIEFVEPGAAHSRLGEGIPDAVVLSAGNRLDTLKKRVIEKRGTIDVQEGQNLMCRPVAMTSNLHNVLFVPEDLTFFVANASHKLPAADTPYAKYDLRALLDEAPSATAPRKKLSVDRKLRETRLENRVVDSNEKTVATRDLEIVDVNDTARFITEELDGEGLKALALLKWKPTSFQASIDNSDRVSLKRSESAKTHGISVANESTLVRFQSSILSGNPTLDTVVLQWFHAKKAAVDSTLAPAILVVHESGKGMAVGKMIARGFAARGLEAFMIELPNYGHRRIGNIEESNYEMLETTMRQSIADVRRAYDVIAMMSGVDPERISLQGTSLGGFVTATVAGFDCPFYRTFILLAGADLYGVVSKGQRDAAKVRKKLAAAGMSEEQMQKLLGIVEPLHFARRIPSERCYLYAGRHDTVVPLEHSNLLAKAAELPDDHYRILDVDHYLGILILPQILNEMSAIAAGQNEALRISVDVNK